MTALPERSWSTPASVAKSPVPGSVGTRACDRPEPILGNRVADILNNSLRRRFEQNQTDCTYTVLALLPTATENIIEELPVEELTKELQKKRAERLARLNAGEGTGSDLSSVSPSLPEEDRKSLSSFQSEGFLHTSQLADSAPVDGQPQVKRNKTQLWNEVKITCMFPYDDLWMPEMFLQTLTNCSDYAVLYSHLHPLPSQCFHPHSTQPPRPSKLPFQCDLTCQPTRQLDHQLGRP